MMMSMHAVFHTKRPKIDKFTKNVNFQNVPGPTLALMPTYPLGGAATSRNVLALVAKPELFLVSEETKNNSNLKGLKKIRVEK